MPEEILERSRTNAVKSSVIQCHFVDPGVQTIETETFYSDIFCNVEQGK